VAYWRGTAEPSSQVFLDRAYAKAFFKVIDEFTPELVHFHELTSAPVQLFESLKNRGIKTVFSAHDFYALCPTVKLFRPDGTYCSLGSDKLDCHNCSADAGLNRFQQLRYANDQWFAKQHRFRKFGQRVISRIEKILKKRPEAAVYQQRRKDFIKFLGLADSVLLTSRTQEKIFRLHCGDQLKLQLLPLSRATIRNDRPEPRLSTVRTDKLTFLALNIVNPAKGSDLLKSTFADLSREFPNVELRLYGLDPGESPGIRAFGPYDNEQIEEIISEADFGILPSIWPEAYGYVGPEMLSHGLPVIASSIGAMPDYITDSVNGLLFHPNTNGDLATKIRTVITNESLQKKLWEGAANSERQYLTMQEHTDKLVIIYRELLNAGNNSGN
jgi:glycosyltransferase involved in cell wall biosynthesis